VEALIIGLSVQKITDKFPAKFHRSSVQLQTEVQLIGILTLSPVVTLGE
jgi:hypothetical protein